LRVYLTGLMWWYANDGFRYGLLNTPYPDDHVPVEHDDAAKFAKMEAYVECADSGVLA